METKRKVEMKADILGTTYKIKRKNLNDADADGWWTVQVRPSLLEKTTITMLEILNT